MSQSDMYEHVESFIPFIYGYKFWDCLKAKKTTFNDFFCVSDCEYPLESINRRKVKFDITTS